MIADLKPYPAMEDSGLAWLGDVPRHWERTRLKRILRSVDRRSLTGSETLLSLRRDHGVVVYAEHFSRPPQGATTVGFKLARVGQLVVNRMQANNGLVFHCRLDGLVSPDYSVFEASAPLLMDYLGELLRSPLYRAHFRRESTGLGTGSAGFLRLYDDRLLNTIVAAPPLAEQATIVRFLDHFDRRIRRYVRAKQKLIKRLEEQKQAVIQRAVTRGLDPNVRVKPSGVEWLGEVPEHWQVRSFTRCAIERADYRGATPTKTESGVFLVTARNVRKGRIDYEVSREFVAEAEYATIMRRGLPRLGDLLLTMEAPLGHAALVDREDVAFAQRVMRFRFDLARLVPEFVLCSILSPYFQNQLLRRGTGSTALGIKASKLPQLQLLCPSVVEQEEILKHIRVECSPIDAVADRAQREISLLSEYRTRLIADVVTGKLDVREAAARLPDEVDEPESLVDADALDESDGDNVDEELGAAPNEAEE